MRLCLFAVWMGFAWLGMGCSQPDGVGGQATTKREPLAGGVIDPDTTAVYALQLTAPTPLLCSAVLVAPNLLLTARHCVSVGAKQQVTCGQTPLGELVSPADIVLSNRLSFLDAPDPASLLAVERIEVPAGGHDVCGYDLAALLLSNQVLSNQAKADATPLELRLDDVTRVGEPYTAVGYGHFTTNAGSRSGVRLFLSDQRVRCLGESCSVGLPPLEFGGSDGVCLGDSGGPALDESKRVFGIASRSASGCEAPIYSLLSAHADWLHSVLVTASEAGGYPLPHDNSQMGAGGDAGSGNTSQEPWPGQELGGQGDDCHRDRPCQDGLVCFWEGSPEQARCRERCTNTSMCAHSEVCDSAWSVCRSSAGVVSGEGCAHRSPPAAPRGLWGVLCLAWMLMRGRRPRSARARQQP